MEQIPHNVACPGCHRHFQTHGPKPSSIWVNKSGQPWSCCNSRCIYRARHLEKSALRQACKAARKQRRLLKGPGGTPEVERDWGSVSAHVLGLVGSHLELPDRLRAALACKHWLHTLSKDVAEASIVIGHPAADDSPASNASNSWFEGVVSSAHALLGARLACLSLSIGWLARHNEDLLLCMAAVSRCTQLRHLAVRTICIDTPNGPTHDWSFDRLSMGALGRLTRLESLSLHANLNSEDSLFALSSLEALTSLELLQPEHCREQMWWHDEDTALHGLKRLQCVRVNAQLFAPEWFRGLSALAALRELRVADVVLSNHQPFEELAALTGLGLLSLEFSAPERERNNDALENTSQLARMADRLAEGQLTVSLELRSSPALRLDLHSGLLASLAGLGSLTHLELHMQSGEAAGLVRLSVLTALTHLELRCGSEARPVLDENDVLRLGYGLSRLATLALTAPADTLRPDALRHLTRFAALTTLELCALPFMTTQPLEPPAAAAGDGSGSSGAAARQQQQAQGQGQQLLSAAQLGVIASLHELAGVLSPAELQQAYQDEMQWLAQQQQQLLQQAADAAAAAGEQGGAGPAPADNGASRQGSLQEGDLPAMAAAAAAAAPQPAPPPVPAPAVAAPAANMPIHIPAWVLRHLGMDAPPANGHDDGGAGDEAAAAPLIREVLVLGPAFDLAWLPPTLEQVRLTMFAALRFSAPGPALAALRRVEVQLAGGDEADVARCVLCDLVDGLFAPLLERKGLQVTFEPLVA